MHALTALCILHQALFLLAILLEVQAAQASGSSAEGIYAQRAQLSDQELRTQKQASPSKATAWF